MACFTIIVPVLDERDNLDRLFAAFRDIENEFGADLDTRFIMVDDGSTDGTAERTRELAGNLDFTLLHHQTNQGPGRAFATGFAHLAGNLRDDDWVATMEGDNTSCHKLIRQMFTRSKEGYDVILASPYMYGGGITNTQTYRWFLSYMANVFVKEMLGISGIMTMSSFFRLYRGRALRSLQNRHGPGIVERAGFESMVEMLVKMVYLKIAISEVPMVLDTTLRAGKSKMNVIKTIMGYLSLYRLKGRWRVD
ncbi:MAG TPA: glycosyltransferase [Rhodospirillales bacterium]|jgi:dolichol-phosphate mannosyltransferase|nr:glycosyltransferase [Rhodospirillales bacterium]